MEAGGRGPEAAGSELGRGREGGGTGLASFLLPPVRQSISPSARPSRVRPSRPTTAQLSLRLTAVVKRGWNRAPATSCSQSPRFPRRLRTPPRGAARQVPAPEGRVGWVGPGPWRGGVEGLARQGRAIV